MTVRTVTRVLLIVATLSFALASIIHFDVPVPLGVTTVRDPFAGAAVPEAVIAAILATGTVALLTGSSAGRPIALVTTSVALAGTALGLSITLRTGRTGDIAYHIAVFALLTVIIALLAVRGAAATPTAPGRRHRAAR